MELSRRPACAALAPLGAVAVSALQVAFFPSPDVHKTKKYYNSFVNP